MKSVGKQLEAARAGRNWTPEAAAKVTKIRVEQLLDLERDDFTRFPSPAYARGFVRLYSKALGLDDRRMLAQLDGRLESEEDELGYVQAPSVEYIPQRTEITAPIRVSRFGVKIILVLAGLFAGIFLVTLFLSNKAGVSLTAPEPKSPAVATPIGGKKESPAARAVAADDKLPAKAAPKEKDVPMAKPATPAAMAEEEARIAKAKADAAAAAAKAKADAEAAVPMAPIASAPAAPGKHQLMLKANHDSWVRVVAVERDGEKLLFEGVVEAGRVIGQTGEGGSLKPFEAMQFNLKVAVPSAVDVIFDGYNGGPNSNSTTPETFSMPPPGAQ
ncbi:MAG: hypothetical protein B9S32_04010 [Verrucomicrobia bacterium Tous-C9LFEB]|nr:MAG: hypothetical protein B9S32_04010 [Verrucomicrobia bacterium Tous-C9LFEB]